MAKKSKDSKKTRFGNPAKAAADKSVLSFTDVVAHRELDPLMPGFRAWMAAAGVDAEQVDWLSDLLAEFFKNYAQSVPAPDATKLDAALTGEILDSAASFHPEMRLGVSLALNSYLKFLATTQAWAGTQQDLDALLALTGPPSPGDPGLKLAQYVTFPLLTPEDAGKARAEMTYVHRAVALLSWIGNGRVLTETGLLQRKDIAPAAACVDVNAIGAATRRVPAGADDPNQVTSMVQLRRLMDYWQALIDTQLITVAAKRVQVTALGRTLLKNPATALNDTAVLAYFLYYESVIPDGPFDPDNSLTVLVALALADAASNRPLKAESLFEATPPPGSGGFLSQMVAMQVRKLAEEGLVEIGTHITAPPALRSPLASALTLADQRIAERRSQIRTEAYQSNRGPSEAAYRLKIQIDDIAPPVWRSVDVPAETSLDELHQVVQSLFAWQDCHLHEFRTGDPHSGTRYAPEDPEADHWGEPPLDELGVPLNTLLTAPGAEMHYEYDFGDGWGHSITLEKILPAAATGTLPRCTGGTGHAPQEDSFGPYGWMEKLAISLDPRHPEHGDIRQWLGLRKGQNIDPEAFEAARTNRKLAALRTLL